MFCVLNSQQQIWAEVTEHGTFQLVVRYLVSAFIGKTFVQNTGSWMRFYFSIKLLYFICCKPSTVYLCLYKIK
jgi:hypothetical protein